MKVIKQWWDNVSSQKSFQAGIVIITMFTVLVFFGSMDDLIKIDTASKDFAIRLEVYDTVEEVTQRCQQLDKTLEGNLYGCAGGRNMCHIISIPSWETLIHELRHCFEGDWHE